MSKKNDNDPVTRTKKNRIVGSMPVEGEFFCKDCLGRGTVTLSLEEYEAVRLLDYEGLSQEEAAFRMGVARTTLTGIYSSARKKIASFLVRGERLSIDGGAYDLREKKERFGLAGLGDGEKGKKERKMIVAAAYENGDIFPHFGRTEYFKIYRIEDGKVASSEVLSTEGAGHSLIVGWLMEHKVDAVICGGVGGGEVGFLTKAGIRIIAGVSGSADKAVEALLKGELEGVSDPTCQHEEGHGEGCQCHGEGGHCHCGDDK